VVLYDANGNVAGKALIEDTLIRQNKQLDPKVYTDLPKRYGLTNAEFYNRVARGEISISKLIKTISDDLSDYAPEEKKRFRRKSITLTLGETFTNDIHRAARLHNMSASAYVKSLIHEQVRKDAEEYRQKISNSRKTWNRDR
jgi:hypothetical protein